MVEREVEPGTPVRVTYSLTEKGAELGPAIIRARAWAQPLEERGVAASSRPGPAGAVRGRALRPQAAGGACGERARVRLIGEVTGLGAQQGPGLLRAARRRGRGSVRDLAQRPGEGGTARGRPARRRRSGDRRRPRLLPRGRPGLAELLLPGHARAARRRGRPAGPARGAAQAAAGRGPVRAAEAAGAAAAAEDDRGGHRGRRRRPPRPARRARAPRLGGDDRLGLRSGPGPPRRAGDHDGDPGPRGAGRRSRRSSSPAAAAASPTSGPSATRRSAARWRCCACR